MSRIGKQPIKIPNGVTVKLNGPVLEVNGPKGALKRETFGRIKLSQTGSEVVVQPALEDGANFWGLYRTLLANMVEGVTTGFSRQLELVGTGYRAAMSGKNLNLTVGYSHPVNMTPPVGVAFDVDKTGKVVVAGADKELVGRVAAQVRGVREPEPYHGKGIRYVGEVIQTKVGKSSGKK
ncbi:50S ribosomal protein L6 [bacterium]|nr:50S ribosomal protein L6 [bacterium]